MSPILIINFLLILTDCPNLAGLITKMTEFGQKRYLESLQSDPLTETVKNSKIWTTLEHTPVT